VPFSEKFLSSRYVTWLNDQEVVRFSEQRFRKHTLESCRQYLQSFEHSPDHFWAVVSRISEEGHIGNITAHVDLQNRLASVGILLGEKKVWGKGYGTEAFSLVVDFLFNEKGMRKVTAGTMAPNTGMRRIMDRLEMQGDGTRRKHFLLDGKEVDVLYSALFREDWLKREKVPDRVSVLERNRGASSAEWQSEEEA